MKSKKKNKAAKKNSKPTGAGKSLRKVGKGIAKLSTTTKAVGVLALASLGLGYLAKRRSENKGISPTPADTEEIE
ncbi:hypothetical protein ACFQT0_29925 [Hymenobacter humi]|uniref:LPXTG cell wall anchor domain-containing protein n=1 Tax=Hymenobacter humi TaxID=1411620 RepID=A0ABW2UE87_9BACT